MSAEAPSLRCPQCGGPIQPVEDDPFLSCSFCGSHVFLDSGRAVRHFILEPSLDPGMAASALSRWLKDREIVGGAAPSSSELVFFPLWEISAKGGTSVLPAAGALYEGLDRIVIPAGDLKVYAPERATGVRGGKARVVEATVPLVAALSRGAARVSGLTESKIAAGAATPPGGSAVQAPEAEARLLHVPLHLVTYGYRGSVYAAAVDACSGRIYPVTTPRSSESRIDGAFALLLGVGLVLNLVALSFLRRAPLFSIALLGVIAFGLYGMGLRIARWMES